MANQRIKYLFEQYLNKQASPKERDEFLEWVEETDQDEVQELIGHGWSEFSSRKELFTPTDRDNMLATVFNSSLARKHNALWPRIAIAVSITVFLAIIGFAYFNWHNGHNVRRLAHNDITSGHNGATLILSNGKKIHLGDAANGQLAEEAGVEVSKTQNGQLVYEVKKGEQNNNRINVLSTAKGETYQVKLPDGTKVWLNSASSLSYTTSLNNHGKREVKLTGEGYFEVAKDKAHPFVVQTASQEVEVLGTHFNINSYHDEAVVATTLLEGSVKVTSGSMEQVIKPGYQVLNNGSDLKVQTVNTDQITDWKNGDFNLNRVDFRVAMRKIARWYDVDIIYNQSVPEGIKSGGWISRNKPLSNILEFIERSGQVHFKVEGRKVYVSK